MVRLEGHHCQFIRDGNYLIKANTGGAALNPHPRGQSFLAYKEVSKRPFCGLWGRRNTRVGRGGGSQAQGKTGCELPALPFGTCPGHRSGFSGEQRLEEGLGNRGEWSLRKFFQVPRNLGSTGPLFRYIKAPGGRGWLCVHCPREGSS